METLHQLFQQSTGVCTDSRVVAPGNIFFALKGEQFDGNRFAAGALTAGAIAVIVDDPAVAVDDRMLLVENALETLQRLAAYHRDSMHIPFLAITGSNGKTTTKELVSAVLSMRYRTTFTQGNLNNHIGVPLTLLSVPADAEMAVIEMGANHPGEIDALCRIAKPDYGLITNIGKAHLEGFGGFDGVVRTKTELYRFLAGHNGKAFVHANDALLMEKSAGNIRITYGGPHDGVNGSVLRNTGFLHTKVQLGQMILEIPTRLLGAYNLPNILAALCIGDYFGVPTEQMAEAIRAYQPANNRSQFMATASNQVFMDAYNANPSSMEAALLNFFEQPGENKTVILGEMRELGNDSGPEHTRLLQLADSGKLHRIFLVGRAFEGLSLPVHAIYFETTAMLKDWLTRNPLNNNLLLIKGSRANQLEQLINVL
jgi:UDP-N-acetylmuramoyl-tripeptide--D-alanyl-D-alanine ligase